MIPLLGSSSLVWSEARVSPQVEGGHRAGREGWDGNTECARDQEEQDLEHLLKNVEKRELGKR